MKAAYLILGIATLSTGMLIVFYFDASRGSSYPTNSPLGKARIEAAGIAAAVKQLVSEQGMPREADSEAISKALLGNNPKHIEYLYPNAVSIKTNGQLCDPFGQPYTISVDNHVITVKSSAYNIIETQSF